LPDSGSKLSEISEAGIGELLPLMERVIGVELSHAGLICGDCDSQALPTHKKQRCSEFEPTLKIHHGKDRATATWYLLYVNKE